jgi:hypothetical protein
MAWYRVNFFCLLFNATVNYEDCVWSAVDDKAEHCWNDTGEENRSTVSVPLDLPQISHLLSRDWRGPSAVISQRLTARIVKRTPILCKKQFFCILSYDVTARYPSVRSQVSITDCRHGFSRSPSYVTVGWITVQSDSVRNNSEYRENVLS